MRTRSFRLIGALLFLLLVKPAQATQPSPDEMDAARRWLSAHLGEGAAGAPIFSFRLDGTPSAELAWASADYSSRPLEEGRAEHVRTFVEAKTGITVRCVAIEYADFPAVEWTVFLKNTGESDTPILENIQAIDTQFSSTATAGDFRLFYSLGSRQQPEDFAPVETILDTAVQLAPYGGRSSDGVLPFFRLARPEGGGLILGIGWTGQWAASFTKTAPGAVTVQAGMEHTHLRLHPGEEIRTPAILLLFWSGDDALRGNNLLRRLLLKHFTPRAAGQPAVPPIAASPHAVIGFSDTTEANMIEGIGNVSANSFPVDTWWIDAGWHGTQNEWARAVGTWEPNAQRFPRGMKPVADAAHARGLRFLLWFEPERVMPDTWLFDHHPGWLLSPAELPKRLQYQANDRFRLLDLGNPEALAWAKTTLSSMIGEIGIDIYRQDFNMTPLYFWRNGEAADRQGMNEIRHITGLYDLYDTLRREHPALIIDNCASGGRRIDFEIMRRAFSLFRSDLCWEPIPEQSMTYGISYWMPITGVGAIKMDPYDFRSGMGAHMSLALDYYHQPEMWEPAAKAIRQYQEIRPLFSADYYPLTPYSREPDQWIAWQYHSPETGQGLVQAFRREGCASPEITLKLRGLDPEASYTVRNLDAAAPAKTSGRALLEQGLTVTLTNAPGAALIHYASDKPGVSGASSSARGLAPSQISCGG